MSALATDQLTAALEELRAQIADLTARLQRIEDSAAAGASAPVAANGHPENAAPAESSTEVHEEEISPEIMLVISAAVAAFLGERGHIRAVRLVASGRWGQQGRVSIQASHRLDRT